MMTMSFFERMREIGTIRAIGTKRHEVFLIFLSEGLFLGLLGALAGVGLGWGFGWLINSADLTYVPPSSTMAVPLEVRLVLGNIWAPFLTALLSTLVSTLYPAFRAARTRVVEALRYV
jgi:putative ABC transport system permease protein